MPRRELLSPAERETLLAIPTEESEQIRHYTLNRADLNFIRQHRWDHNRLGVAIQLCYAFTLKQFRALVTWLVPLATQTIQGVVLVRSAIDELRTRRIVLPSVAVIERLAAQAATRADRQVFARLAQPLTSGHRRSLDQLLELREGMPYSTLAWLRLGAPSARSVLRHIDRLKVIRALELPADLERRIHHNRLLRLAREGAQTAVYQLKEYGEERRYATLVAIVLEATATLTDEILDLHDRMIGKIFAKSRHKHERQFSESAPDLHETVRLFAKIGSALLKAREHSADPFAAIESVLPWVEFETRITATEKLAAAREADFIGLLGDHYGELRRYAPALLETFDFKAAPAVAPLVEAIGVL